MAIGSSGIVMGTSFGSTGSASTNGATLNLNGGVTTVGGSIVMATQNATSGNNAVTSTINLLGGTLTVGGNILCNAGAASPAARLTRLNLNGTSVVLDLTGHAIGGVNNTATASVNFIDSLNFQAGTLQNVGQINGGTSLVKSGTGILILAGTNTYTGGTTVSNGTLDVTGVISGSGLVTVLGGTTLTGTGSIQGPVIVSGTLLQNTLAGGRFKY